MHPPRLRLALPWLIGISLAGSFVCLALAVWLGLAARADAIQTAARRLAAQADGLARQIDSDMAQYDLTLREAARILAARDPATAPPKLPLLDLPLTAQYFGFINILNESGDVVADPRSNVSRPVNFAGRDYFQDHLKNPADTIMIGRPFATAPTQHASIPISRRLNRPDGNFAGVVVAGVRLAWLSDLLSLPSPGPHPTITIRRDDGLILMRAPYDADAIGRVDAADPAWRDYLRTGQSPAPNDQAGVLLFRHLGTPPLVLELALSPDDIAAGERAWLVWLPLLALIPALGGFGLSLAASGLRRRGDEIEAETRIANDERMRLLATMSHELRSPLTGILGQAELMADEGGLTDRQTTRLARLTEAGTLMRGIVDRVTDVARPDDLLDVPHPTACDVDPLIRTCLAVVESEARRKGVLLTSSVDADAPRRTMLDRELVQQMIINLLMNAVKFTTHGTVALRVEGTPSLIRFEVADTGPGIPDAKRRRLFRAYDRLDTPASRAAGTGLGLSITERFVKRMRGRISHADNPGGGSVFRIDLPTSPPRPSAAAVREPEPEPLAEIRHLRVLLADDMDLTRGVTAAFLRSAGHLVIEVPDGEAAVAEVQTTDFDVVLTDMRMPIVDGLEVTRRIRALPGHQGRTPVVLVTADLQALDAGQSGQFGVDVCVRKPFTRAELLTAVATAARLKPVPDAETAADKVIDEEIMAELKQSLDDGAFAIHLDTAARRIDELATLLESPDAADNSRVRDTVHDLIGVSGLMGLNALSLTLRWFDTATNRTAPAAALHQAAAAAVRALRRLQEPAANR